MTKADILFKENIQTILDKGVFSQQARPKYPNGQTAHSKYITGSFATYDIKADDFKLINYDPVKPQLTFDLAI